MNFEYQDTLSGSMEATDATLCLVGVTNACGSTCTVDTEAVTIEPIPQPGDLG